MLLSETDAKTKQCRVMPPASPSATQTFVLNGQLAMFPVSCAASGCMHWRWGEPSYEDGPAPYHEPQPEGDGWEIMPAPDGDMLTLRWRRVIERRGYCGLAGRP